MTAMPALIPRLMFLLAAVIAAAAALPLTGDAAVAANGAYAVDAADISDLGSCKLESWISTATNTDFSAVANPSCVVEIGRPVELTLQTNYARMGGDLSTTLSPKLKFNIEPTGIGKWGYSFLASAGIDAQTGQTTSFLAEIPLTYRFSEVTRINLNAAVFRDAVANRSYFSYGAGFDWKFTDLLQYTIEVYGLLGDADMPSFVRPRVQTGIRYRPNEIFSLDIIYGHNITGENANWITVGTTIRFPPPGGSKDSTGPRKHD